MNYKNLAASVSKRKILHPEDYCKSPNCLWRTKEDYCPRHGGKLIFQFDERSEIIVEKEETNDSTGTTL